MRRKWIWLLGVGVVMALALAVVALWRPLPLKEVVHDDKRTVSDAPGARWRDKDYQVNHLAQQYGIARGRAETHRASWQRSEKLYAAAEMLKQGRAG